MTAVDYEVNHLCLVVRDVKIAEQFYVDVLGLKPDVRTSKSILLRINNKISLHLFEVPKAELNTNLYSRLRHIGISVNNLKSLFENARTQNLDMFDAPKDKNYSLTQIKSDSHFKNRKSIFLKDPNGNLFEFSKNSNCAFSGIKFGKNKYNKNSKSSAGININGVEHISSLVLNFKQSKECFEKVFGMTAHHQRNDWLVLSEEMNLHSIIIPEMEVEKFWNLQLQHIAYVVTDIFEANKVLLENKKFVFQMDTSGNHRVVTKIDDPLDFGQRTLFVYDPDGNLTELLQKDTVLN